MKCLIKDCNREAIVRGLCSNHYQVISNAVLKGKFTWEQLIEKGIALESRKRGDSNFVAKLQDLLKD